MCLLRWNFIRANSSSMSVTLTSPAYGSGTMVYGMVCCLAYMAGILYLSLLMWLRLRRYLFSSVEIFHLCIIVCRWVVIISSILLIVHSSHGDGRRYRRIIGLLVPVLYFHGLDFMLKFSELSIFSLISGTINRLLVGFYSSYD